MVCVGLISLSVRANGHAGVLGRPTGPGSTQNRMRPCRHPCAANVALARSPAFGGAACGTLPFAAGQSRGLKWPAWLGGGRGSDDAVPVEALQVPEPLLDVEAVEQIVALAGPQALDAATWPMIHAGAWYHTYAAELMLQSLHDMSGLTWFGVIPITVFLMRTATLPVMVEMQRASHHMAKSKGPMQAMMEKMQAQIERGKTAQQAQVRADAVAARRARRSHRTRCALTRSHGNFASFELYLITQALTTKRCE